MVTNTNNGSGSHNHLSSSSSSLLNDRSPYRHRYFSSPQDSGQTDDMDANKILPPIGFAVFAVFFCLLCSRVLRTDTEEQEAGGGGNDSDNTVRQLQSNEVGSGWVDRAPSSMAPPVRTDNEPPLVCTYRKADGWREGSCGVCLAEMDDGDAVRVLPVCMHYFPAACVGEWLRVHATCPLCRAPLVAPTSAPGDGEAASASTDAPAEADPTSVSLPDGPRTLNPRLAERVLRAVAYVSCRNEIHLNRA